MRHKVVAAADGHRVAQMRAQFRRHLFLGDEQFGGAIGVGEHERQRHRGALDIRAAQVEQPRHPVERRNDRRIEAARGEPFSHRAALGLARLPGVVVAVDHGRSERWRGPVMPHRVDRIPLDRDHRGTLGGQRRAARSDPGLAVQPRIEAYSGPSRSMLGEPRRDARAEGRFIAEQLPVDLLAHLHGIASIDENCRRIRQHHRRPGRAAKPGQPRQPLSVGADIFAHVLVRDRHHEASEIAALEFLAQVVKAGLVDIHQHGKIPGRACGDSGGTIERQHDSFHSSRRSKKAARRNASRHHAERRIRLAARPRLS